MKTKKEVCLNVKNFFKNNYKTLFTILMLLIACTSVNNFYKITVGYVANEFEGGLFHLTIMIAYFLPYLCFAVYFCNYYVKKLNKLANMIYSLIIIAISIFVLIGVFSNIDVYLKNYLLGGFPIDAMITSVVLLIAQGYNISLIVKPNHKLAHLKENWYSLNAFKINIFEYLLLTIVSLLVFFFTGDFISGLLMIENVIYDPKFIFILLWLLLGSMGNLLAYVFKFENKIKTKKNKIIYLASNILVNGLLVVLFVLFGKLYPNYIPAIAKPLFPITFSKSIPIEMMMLFGIQALAVLVCLVKILITLLKKEKQLVK